jgi:glutaminyl-tRNA synthetase
LETGNGMPADGRKVRGTIHWLDAESSVPAELRLYNHLFTQENVANVLEEDNAELLNPNSMERYPNARTEASLRGAAAGQTFQFVRQGYFCKDAGEVWNRAAPLKSGWKG